MHSCFDLVGSCQLGVASNEVIRWLADHPLQMVMTSDETQIQIFSDWPMSHAKRVTKENGKNPDVVVAIRRLLTDKTVLQKNHDQTMLKMSKISDLERPTAQKILKSLNTIMRKDCK